MVKLVGLIKVDPGERSSDSSVDRVEKLVLGLELDRQSLRSEFLFEL